MKKKNKNFRETYKIKSIILKNLAMNLKIIAM